jgi:tRNA-dihydrouridine synthase B
MSIHIGPVSLPIPVVLAPMSGITDTAFRRIARRLGAGLVVSEMVVSRELLTGSREGLRRIRFDAAEAPLAIQLAGNEADSMAEAARRVAGEGAEIVDINMGCPAKKVCNGYAGSALMRDLRLACYIIEKMVKAVSVPITLKMRLGWDEGSLNAPELARRAQDLGIRAITVHGRTRNQFYTGRADWRAVRAVKDAVDVPVLVNGDIGSAADAREALRRSGADGVMVGRACQGRPWLPGQMAAELAGKPAPAAPGLEQRRAIALEHLDGMLEHHGAEFGVRCFRKHFAWYAADMPNGALARAEINRLEEPAAVRRAVAEAFQRAAEVAQAA